MSLKDKNPLEIALFLNEIGITQAISTVFEDNEIDGEAFVELTLDELNSLIPNKLGVVKKIYRIIQAEAAAARPMSSPPLSVQSVATEGSEPEHLSACVTTDKTAKPPSTSSSRSLDDPGPSDRDIVDGDSSFESYSQPCLTSNTRLHVSKFVLPTQWRPSIMNMIQRKDESEKRRLLTPDIRNAVVRDLVSSMYAYESQPKKEFCTTVAKKLVAQYPFMKDAGSAVSGYGSWEKKLIERIHNVAKTGKRPSSEPAASAPKRGRPKADNPIMQRYPPLPYDDEFHDYEQEEQALKKELEKEKPRKEVIVQLMRSTFQSRRRYILTKSSNETVLHLTSNFKALVIPHVMEQEMDLILKRRDAVNSASEDWKKKWTPAITKYSRSLKGKVGTDCKWIISDMYPYDSECQEKRALMLIVLMLLKGNVTENLKRFYIEHQIDEDLDELSASLPTPTPVMAFIEKVDGTGTYVLIIEKKVWCTGIPTFCHALALWFAVHYIFNLEYSKDISEVAIFMQEFLFGLPATRAKKSATYLTVCSNIQGYTEM